MRGKALNVEQIALTTHYPKGNESGSGVARHGNDFCAIFWLAEKLGTHGNGCKVGNGLKVPLPPRGGGFFPVWRICRGGRADRTGRGRPLYPLGSLWPRGLGVIITSRRRGAPAPRIY